jgi:hypothetical protein
MEEAPTAQTIEQYLYDLAFDEIYDRIKNEFNDWDHIHSEAFQFADDQLTAAYMQWAEHHNAHGALTYLERVSDICNERLQPAYLSKYNDSVSFLTAESSRASTPVDVDTQGARMQNLILRMTACLH